MNEIRVVIKHNEPEKDFLDVCNIRDALNNLFPTTDFFVSLDEQGRKGEKVGAAVEILIAAIYFKDNSDYLSSMHHALLKLDKTAWTLLTKNSKEAYDKYCGGRDFRDE